MQWIEHASDDAAVRRFGPADGDVEAVARLDRHLLDPAWRAPAEGRLVIAWSGTLADGLFDAHPYNWMAPGRAALDARAAEIGRNLANAGRRLVLLPHARHILSDAPGALAFHTQLGEIVGVALGPAWMLEPSMLGDVEDHLMRFARMLGAVADVAWVEDARLDGDACTIAAPGTGVIQPRHVAAAFDAYLPAEVPVIDRLATIADHVDA